MRNKSFDNNGYLFYLIATPIGNLSEINQRAIDTISSCDFVACEDTRVSGKLLSHLRISKPLISCREHNENNASEKIVNLIKEGKIGCYMSDAGYPLISDPGQRLIANLINEGIKISTISGACAFLNALVGSNLPTEKFFFYGFLDSRDTKRVSQLKEVEHFMHTLIFYESPHRLEKTLKDMYKIFGNRQICIARELTKLHEEYIRDTLENIILLDFNTIKGEIVIVVEGKIEKEIVYDETSLYNLVKKQCDLGISPKEAIGNVAKKTKVSKNVIYNIYHRN